MAFETTKRDIVIGIDFGMTCSGVAYSYGPDWPDQKTIQHWPGKLGHEIRNKVDTSISYDLRTNDVVSWGFLCNPADESREYNSLFKLYLDPDYRDSAPDPPCLADAQRWYLDYLTALYNSLMRYFRNVFPHFMTTGVDFVFSVPVTWKNSPALLVDIKALIRTAGFGTRAGDSASVTLTEAEAAAVHASKGRLTAGDVFMVCDAGGGTTDLTSLKVVSTKAGHRELFPQSWTEGAAIGSTLIDFKVRELVRERLRVSHPQSEECDLPTVLDHMLGDKFEAFKCSFGNSDIHVPSLEIPIPDCVDGARITVTLSDLRKVFDDQIEKMCALIDAQLSTVRQRCPSEPVSFLVLSGGLGSSPYVQSRVRARYEDQTGRPTELQVLVSSEPQMAVAHGLVLSRMQGCRGGEDVLTQRCLGMSYGILCKELYDPLRHFSEVPFEDPYDKRQWVDSQIHWVLKQGQVIRGEYILTEQYSLKIAMGRELDPWSTTLVMSNVPVNMLPCSMRSGRASVVCSITATLSLQDMKRKNRHWYDFSHEYNRADFLLRIIVGTGLRFEIASLNGTVRSRSHEIAVQWSRPVSRDEPLDRKHAMVLDGKQSTSSHHDERTKSLNRGLSTRVELPGSSPGRHW